MVENAQIFQNMLMQGEEVVRVFKPHKGRFWASRFLGHLPAVLMFMLFFGVIAFMLRFGGIDNTPGTPIIVLLFLAAFLIIPLIFIFGELFAGIWWYRNRWYCFTNKRIIIQCGVFMRNFRFMDLQWASNSFVRVSVLDRLLGKQTGTIKFSNMGSPMMNFGGSRGMSGSHGFTGAMFYFLYVQHPHDILREIQEQANKLQNQGNTNQQNLADQINNLAAQIGNMQAGGSQQGNANGQNLAAQVANLQQQAAQAPQSENWVCGCGTNNNGKFCGNCGSGRP